MLLWMWVQIEVYDNLLLRELPYIETTAKNISLLKPTLPRTDKRPLPLPLFLPFFFSSFEQQRQYNPKNLYLILLSNLNFNVIDYRLKQLRHFTNPESIPRSIVSDVTKPPDLNVIYFSMIFFLPFKSTTHTCIF